VAGAELIRMRAATDRLGGIFTFDEYPLRESADLPFAFETIVREKRVRLLSITIRRQFRDCEGDPACPLGNDCIRHYPLTPFAGAMLDYEYAITSLNLITSPVIDGPQYKPADRFTIRTVVND
jgi:hypothetical protein